LRMLERSGGSSTDSRVKPHPMAAALKVCLHTHEPSFTSVINSLVQEFLLE
jgi:hypothetical protein